MPRITHVQHARQRTDAEGKLKPNLTCDLDDIEIKPGDSYKHMSIKTGPRSSRKLVRCAACPNWQVWEYSNSTGARTAQIVHTARQAVEAAEDKEGVEGVLQEAAEAIRELAEEKSEGAQNIEDGFGHATSQSEELSDLADQLESWADAVEQAELPDDPEPEEDACVDCEGAGRVEPVEGSDYDEDDEDQDGKIKCENCDGTGLATPDGPTEDQIDGWRQEVEDATSILDESPA